MMYSKKKWWLIAGGQVLGAGVLAAVAAFEIRSRGEVSIFSKYAVVVWSLYIITHAISIFLEPISKDEDKDD